MMNQVHELLTSLCLFESTAELAGGSHRVLLLYATHLHAHMLGFHHYHDTSGVQCLFDTFANLQRHALLHLQAVTVDIYYTGNL